MNNEKFDIFVSYAHEDKRFVGEVIQKLSSAGLSVWIDKEIHHGESISSRIVKAIERATFVLFFSSKSSNVSDYCIGEILVAVQKKKCIIPIKIDSSDYCDDLLVHLIRLHYVNFIDGFSTEEYEELVCVLAGKTFEHGEVSGVICSSTKTYRHQHRMVIGALTCFTIIICILFALKYVCFDREVEPDVTISCLNTSDNSQFSEKFSKAYLDSIKKTQIYSFKVKIPKGEVNDFLQEYESKVKLTLLDTIGNKVYYKAEGKLIAVNQTVIITDMERKLRNIGWIVEE